MNIFSQVRMIPQKEGVYLGPSPTVTTPLPLYYVDADQPRLKKVLTAPIDTNVYAPIKTLPHNFDLAEDLATKFKDRAPFIEFQDLQNFEAYQKQGIEQKANLFAEEGVRLEAAKVLFSRKINEREDKKKAKLAVQNNLPIQAPIPLAPIQTPTKTILFKAVSSTPSTAPTIARTQASTLYRATKAKAINLGWVPQGKKASQTELEAYINAHSTAAPSLSLTPLQPTTTTSQPTIAAKKTKKKVAKTITQQPASPIPVVFNDSDSDDEKKNTQGSGLKRGNAKNLERDLNIAIHAAKAGNNGTLLKKKIRDLSTKLCAKGKLSEKKKHLLHSHFC